MPVYLDNAATTQVCPAAAEAALAAMTEEYGNPSSRHAFGRAAALGLKAHRGDVAAALGCPPESLVFTSCGTEGDNWAIRAAVALGSRRGKHIITSAIEHAAVLEPLRALAQQGYEVTHLKPDATGHILPDDFARALRPDTIFASLMLVNNELGTVQPVAQCAALAHAYHPEILFHTDAVQGFLKLPFTPQALGVDLLTISGHKIHAPKGVGGLYFRRGLHLKPWLLGGGQENGLRPGTEPTAQIAAFAAAARQGAAHQTEDVAHMCAIKQYARAALPAAVPGVEFIGTGEAPHILPIALPGYQSEVLVRFLGDLGVCVSSGSACHRGKPSHVYAALPLSKRQLGGILRVSFCPGTTAEEIDALAAALAKAKAQLFPSMS